MGMIDDDIAEAVDRVARLRSRRADLMLRGGELELATPACTRGCPRCYRECAVTGIILDWWERELHRLQPTNVIAFPDRASVH
jgi:hypothetical protein